MDASYASEYRELYERHWWWRARERFILAELDRLRPAGGWTRILDVGCGDALFFDALATYGEVEGVESDESLVTPDGKHRARIHVGPFDRTFRPGHEFGLILMLDVVEHLTDPRSALAYAYELLEAGGILFVTVPAFMLLWTRHDVLNRHFTRYMRASFTRLAQSAGFEVEHSRYFYHWMVPAKFATRMLEALRPAGEPRPPRVPPRLLNRLLYLLSRGEQRLTRERGLPFGSSLLVIARKAPRVTP